MAPVAPVVAAEPEEAFGASVTARWLVLTTDVNPSFARAVLPEGLGIPEQPQIAVWIVEPLSSGSAEVGDPFDRLFAGLSCSCLRPGDLQASAFTSDILVGSPTTDRGGRDAFGLPAIPHTGLALVNGVGGMGLAISPVSGDGRGLVGTVALDGCGSQQTRLTPDWLARQSWRERPMRRQGTTARAAASGTAADGLVHTRWKLTRLSPIVEGSAVLECAEFGSRGYDISATVTSLDARYGFARVTILGRD
ncbi:hypothetical protein ERC79_07250 [Rhodococcus sp. ABRD24]|uniref:hypothetical protein n=1 Tax=Rhodococcus sp. ABRD24 TaxID=2507582 RepID=UPI001040D19B|nr:hypothetical protein [Rhodococcus sp. ABRD24]QBJ95781.1 hypothetical protein ERC79_07250 [Rhodococcus sp. ABRD24]